MIAPIQVQPINQLREIARDTFHPFQQFACRESEAMQAARSRFDVGALVTNGETGAACAAMDLGAALYIPLTGFAPREKFNERGTLEPHRARLLLEPNETFSTLTPDEARTDFENYAPYARRRTIEEAEALNAHYSCAVAIMSPGELAPPGSIDVGRLKLLGNHKTFVCDLTQDPIRQALALRDFLSTHAPWFLNIVGPRETLHEMCNYSVYDRVRTILLRALPDRSSPA